MSLGDTIRVSPGRAAGTWGIQTSELSIVLSDRADVSVSGGLLLGAGLAPRLTVTLRQSARGASLSTLRRDLLPFCRPEAGGLTLTYTGAVRTLFLPCRYVDGLEVLQLVLEARSPTWRASFADTMSGMVEGTLALNTPSVITPQGTAGSPPLFYVRFGASSSLTSIENAVTGIYDLFYQINFAGEMPQNTTLQIDCALVIVTAGYLNLVQPGSTFGSFRLIGGVENVLTVSGSGLTDLRYGYYPRFWSWEDADV